MNHLRVDSFWWTESSDLTQWRESELPALVFERDEHHLLFGDLTTLPVWSSTPVCLHSPPGQWLIRDITNYYLLMVCWAHRISPAALICSAEVRDEAAHWNQAQLVWFIRGLGSVYKQVAKRKAHTHRVRHVAWSDSVWRIFIRADPCLDPALVSVSVRMAGVSQDVWALYRKVLRHQSFSQMKLRFRQAGSRRTFPFSLILPLNICQNYFWEIHRISITSNAWDHKNIKKNSHGRIMT